MIEVQVNIINNVLKERNRQDAKWGEQNHNPQFWTGILGEEYGEFCEAINETVFNNGTDKGGYDNMKNEAIHVAAVAIGFLECLERNKEHWFESKKSTDNVEAFIDEVGGFHDCRTGRNPRGVFCGECGNITCKDCKHEHDIN